MLLSIIIDQLSIIIDNASPCGKCGFPPVLCRSKHDEIASKVLELEMPHDCGSQLFATTKVEKRQNIDSSAKSDRPVCSRLYPPVRYRYYRYRFRQTARRSAHTQSARIQFWLPLRKLALLVLWKKYRVLSEIEKSSTVIHSDFPFGVITPNGKSSSAVVVGRTGIVYFGAFGTTSNPHQSHTMIVYLGAFGTKAVNTSRTLW